MSFRKLFYYGNIIYNYTLNTFLRLLFFFLPSEGRCTERDGFLSGFTDEREGRTLEGRFSGEGFTDGR